MAKLLPSQLPPLLPSPRKPAFSLSRSPEVPQIFSPCGPPHQCSSVVELPPSRLPPLLPSPRAPASPQRRSLACSLPRSPEVPCLPLLFPALRAGASRESASCLSAGGPPFEVAIVARSCSTVASVVLAFGVPAPPDWCFRCLHPPSWCRQGGQTYVASRGFPMRVACWNVRGLSARYRRRYLSSWVRQNGPSVLIVVETKMFVVSHACVRTLMHQPSFGFLPANGTAGGILLAWSPPLTGAVVHIGRYSISASLSGFWPNGPVLVTAVYGPCVGALRGQLWAELHQVRQLAASPWLLAGDFNCLLSPADSSSPVSFGQSMSAFRSFVDEFGLFDVPSTNGTFTWSNNRNPPILRRLDRIFLSPELFSAFPSSSLDLGPRHLSDHAPLLLSLHRGRAGSGPARFRFELWWLRDESFVATVPIWWARAVNGRWAAFRLSRKLHFIRRETLAWKRIFWSSKFSEVADWDEEIMSLQASDNISVDQSSRLLCLQCLAQEWRIRESIHWQQRSRLGWLAHGDQNSRFFHLAASQRRRQMLLQSMVIGSRVCLGDDILPALSTHFWDFYSKPLRFRAPLPDFHLSSLSVSCAISLERPFLHQEIKNAVWALGSGKAPGIDEVCSTDVFEFCDEFASNSIFLKEFNRATCVLVPKRPNPTDVTHFRPISILGTPYNIIAKLLSLRLAPVMPSIISPFQVAFIKGRRLQDAVVLANEVVHSLYCLRLPSFILNVLASTWPSLVNSLPNPPSIRLLFLFCPSPRLAASWGHVWRSWLISAWWRIWEERNNRVFRGTFSSPDSVARRVQGDVQFAIRLKRRCSSAAG
ncbi:Transposon TX1 uncharacterized protein [Nymphaea thermarum]|nr:Transposon TX1 uncharacterized protein [Nymphaea thermarum]